MLRRASSQQSLTDLCSAAGPLLEVPKHHHEIERRLLGNKRKIFARMQGDLKRNADSKKVLASRRSLQTSTVQELAQIGCSSQKSGTRNKLVLLNLLAALYGLGNVLAKFVEITAPGAPTSLSSAVKYASASLVILPFIAFRSSEFKDDLRSVLRAGVELGIMDFAHSIIASCSPSSTDLNETSLLYAITVFSIPIMQLFSGRSSKATWLAIFAALSGMGLLEEEGSGWKGIVLPSFGNSWAVLEAGLSVLQLLRSGALTKKHDPIQLNAIQLMVLSILNIVLELSHFSSFTAFLKETQTLPWLPSIFSGLVCIGIGSLVEMRGLHGLDRSSIAISHLMIPIWGAFFSVLQQGRSSQEIATLSGMVFVFARVCVHLQDRVTSNDESLQDRVINKVDDDDQKPSSGGNFLSQLPVAFLSSQLKFPFYANQAQALLTDMDKNINSDIDAQQSIFLQIHKSLQIQDPAGNLMNVVHVLVTLVTSFDSSLVTWSVQTFHQPFF